MVVRAVTCFADARDRDIELLFRALRDALEAVPLAGTDDVWWANALTSFAFLRTLTPEFLAHHLQTLDEPDFEANDPGSASFQTQHVKLAAMAYTTLYTGLRFDGSETGWAGRWIDLTDFSNATDMVDAILRELICCLKDHGDAMPRRVNPDNPVHDRLIGDLRVDFKDRRQDGEASGLCIRRPDGLSDEVWTQALRDLASRLAADVVGYETRNAASLSLESTRVTPDELAAQMHRVFALMKPAKDLQTAKSLDSSPRPVGVGWDFFVSHASEDKEDFVDGLVARLKALNLSVWYDKEQILVGDSIVARIEEGLRQSRSAVIVISPRSIKKAGWVPAEWEVLLEQQITSGKPVFPVLLDIDHAEMKAEKPFLGRCRAADASKGILHVADELIKPVLRRHGDAP